MMRSLVRTSARGWLIAGLTAVSIVSTEVLAEALDIPFNQAPQAKPLLNISVEVGGYDVTSFTSITDQGVSIDLGSELPPGEYTAAILAFYEDGEVQTLSEQTITLSAGPSTHWEYNSTLSTSFRVDEDRRENFGSIDSYNARGGIDANVIHSDGNLELSATLQSVYDSNDNNHISGNEWEIANYQVGAKHTGDYGGVGIYAGNTPITTNNLLFANYQRRGVNVQLHNASQTLQSSFFSVISDISTAYDKDLLTPDNTDEETLGATLSVNPFSAHPDRLAIGFGYVDGKGTTAGAGFTVYDPDTIYGGSSWNTTIDSLWLNRALWIHLEYAESDFDSDGIDVGEDEVSDDAYKVFVNLNSNGDLPRLGMDYWDLTLSQQEIGNKFYSISNLGLAGDLDAQRMTLNASRGGFSVVIDAMRQENNVDNDPTRPTQSIDYDGIDITYTPHVDISRALWRTLGQPSVNAYLHRTDTYQLDEDASVAGYDVDHENREHSLSINFQADRWSWGVQHTVTDVEDNSRAVIDNFIELYTPTDDNENRLTNLQISWYPNARFTLSPNFQWNTFEEDTTGNKYDTFNVNLDTQIQIIPNKLLLAMNYSFSGNDNRFGDPLYADSEIDNHTGSFKITWKAIEARLNRPGLDVYLDGSYRRFDDRIANADTEDWQLNIGFNYFWAGTKQ
jgi:hypothetical protein